MPQPQAAIASLGSHIQPSGCTSTSASTARKTRPAGAQACSGRPRAWYLAHRHPGQASPPPQQPTPCLSLTSPSPPSVATFSPQAVPPPPPLPLTKRDLLVLRLVQGARAHGTSRTGTLAKPHRRRSSPTPCLSLKPPSPTSVATSSPQAVPPPSALPLTKRGLLVLRLVQGAHAHGTSRTGTLAKPHHRRSSPRHASASPRHRLPR